MANGEKKVKLALGYWGEVKGDTAMVDREKEWIDRLAKAKSLSKEEPHLLVQTGHDKIEIALYSELAPLLRIGDWAVITVSPR